MDYQDEDSLSKELVYKNEKTLSSTLSPIRKQATTSELGSADSKNEQLFKLHKENETKRLELHKKGTIDKEHSEIGGCTFNPKVNKFVKTEFSQSTIHKESFDSYVDRVAKFRDTKKEWHDQCKSKAGSGKKWKKSVTIPDDDLNSKTFSAPLKTKPAQKPKNSDKLNKIVEWTESEGVKIEEAMKYCDAVKYLHDQLHSIKME